MWLISRFCSRLLSVCVLLLGDGFLKPRMREVLRSGTAISCTLVDDGADEISMLMRPPRRPMSEFSAPHRDLEFSAAAAYCACCASEGGTPSSWCIGVLPFML